MEKRMQHGYFIRVFSAIKWENLKREQSTRECEREGYFLRQVGRKILINSIIKRSHTHTNTWWVKGRRGKEQQEASRQKAFPHFSAAISYSRILFTCRISPLHGNFAR